MTSTTTKITTKKGDNGTTQLGDGSRVLKNNLRIIAIGELDELNSALDMVLANKTLPPAIKNHLTDIQQDLRRILSELALAKIDNPLTSKDIEKLENNIDTFSAQLPLLKTFITFNHNMVAATCHLAKSICRRAEHSIVTLHQAQPVNANILAYINRLSDLLFVIARVLNDM